MARIYPKHAVRKEYTDSVDFEKSQSVTSHFNPTGLDEVETYTDVYNVPHDPPQRAMD